MDYVVLWVKQWTIPQITIFIGGMIPIPRKMGGLWHCFTHINLCHNMEISLMIIIYIFVLMMTIFLMTIFNDVFETLQSCFVVICRLYDFKSKLETSVAKYLWWGKLWRLSEVLASKVHRFRVSVILHAYLLSIPQITIDRLCKPFPNGWIMTLVYPH